MVELDEVAQWDRTGRAVGRTESGAAALAEDLRRLVDRIENADALRAPIRMGDLTSAQRRHEPRENMHGVGDKRSAER